ncbi:hypothetical protein AHAS_Ahas16G0188200 [Arachis hypogaea]
MCRHPRSHRCPCSLSPLEPSPSLEPAAFVAVHCCRRHRCRSALEPPTSRTRRRGVLVTVMYPVIAAASNPAVDAVATATTILELLHRWTSLLEDRMERLASSAFASGFLESEKMPLSLLFVGFKIAVAVLALFYLCL